MNKKNIIITLAITFFVIAGMYLVTKVDAGTPYKKDALNEFATCITNSGAKFYGAFWCSHCQNQKKAFQNAADALPYVECATENNTQTPVCAEAKIEGYPTWSFPNGELVMGEQSFQTLAEKTGCTAPAM
jgi:hypothetical protein